MNAGGVLIHGRGCSARDHSGKQRVIQRRHGILKIKRSRQCWIERNEAVDAGLRAQQIHFIQPRRVALDGDCQIIFQRQ